MHQVYGGWTAMPSVAGYIVIDNFLQFLHNMMKPHLIESILNLVYESCLSNSGNLFRWECTRNTRTHARTHARTHRNCLSPSLVIKCVVNMFHLTFMLFNYMVCPEKALSLISFYKVIIINSYL